MAAPDETSTEETQPVPDVADESAKAEEQNELAEKTVVSQKTAHTLHQLIYSISSHSIMLICHD